MIIQYTCSRSSERIFNSTRYTDAIDQTKSNAIDKPISKSILTLIPTSFLRQNNCVTVSIYKKCNDQFKCLVFRVEIAIADTPSVSKEHQYIEYTSK